MTYSSLSHEESIEDPRFDYQLQLLMKEIALVHSRIRDYNDLSFKIKGWAVTLWAAIVVLGTQLRRADVIIIAIVVALVFLALDVGFHIPPMQTTRRLRDIEDFLNDAGMYSGKGLQEAFKQGSFGVFPVNDPGRRLSSGSYKPNDFFLEGLNFRGRLIGFTSVILMYVGLSIAALVFAILI